MRLFGCLLLLMSTVTVHAQNVDIPDYRKKNDNFTKIREKDIRADVSTFAIAGIDERMNKEPLTNVISPVSYGSDYIRFEGDNIKVTIKAGTFDPEKHKLYYYEYYDDKYLVKIDNKPFFGHYGAMPSKTIESVEVIIDKDTVNIPQAALFDLYSPEFAFRDASGSVRTHNRVIFSKDKNTLYIYMLNKEVKGNYEVTWVIRDKKYLRRVVDTGLLQ